MSTSYVNVGHAPFFDGNGQILIIRRLVRGFILRQWVELFGK
jgi:hypothetical protein